MKRRVRWCKRVNAWVEKTDGVLRVWRANAFAGVPDFSADGYGKSGRWGWFDYDWIGEPRTNWR